MSGHHVGKETDHQCEGLGEDAYHLDDGNERCRIRLEEQGHLGPEDFLPVFLVAEDVDQEHRAEGEEERDVDVARHVGSTGEDGQQTEQIGHEDEEEDGEQIRGIPLIMLLTDAGLDHVVVDIHHEHLHRTHKSLGSLAGGIVLLVPPRHAEEHGYQDDGHNPDLAHRLGDAQVERALGGAVGHLLVDFAMVRLVEEEVAGQRLLRAERPFSRGTASQDDGQRNAHIARNVPLVGIRQVVEHNLGDVDGLLFPIALSGQQMERHAHHHENEQY